MRPSVLDLFSGIGGFSLGLDRAGMRTIAFCEIEDYPRRVLRKHWPDVPIFDDVRTLQREDLPEQPDVIVGGYPCQPFSLAGKRAGEEDDRHLWPEMLRLVETCRPRWVIAENVAGHITMGLDQVLSDLEGAGYTVWPFVIPAVAVDAPHRRDRVWIVANASSGRCRRERSREIQWTRGTETERASQALADAEEKRLEGVCLGGESGGEFAGSESARRDHPVVDVADTVPCRRRTRRTGRTLRLGQWGEGISGGYAESESAIWPTEPDVGRVADGVPKRVDRLRALGNAVVPQIPEMIGRAILESEARHATA